MPKFKVYAERRETLCAIIEAQTMVDAEYLADKNYCNYDWSEVNDSMQTEILFDRTIEEEDDE